MSTIFEKSVDIRIYTYRLLKKTDEAIVIIRDTFISYVDLEILVIRPLDPKFDLNIALK